LTPGRWYWGLKGKPPNADTTPRCYYSPRTTSRSERRAERRAHGGGGRPPIPHGRLLRAESSRQPLRRTHRAQQHLLRRLRRGRGDRRNGLLVRSVLHLGHAARLLLERVSEPARVALAGALAAPEACPRAPRGRA